MHHWGFGCWSPHHPTPRALRATPSGLSQGEEERSAKFKAVKPRMLLWHGSRLTNFMGILSQGLRCAGEGAAAGGGGSRRAKDVTRERLAVKAFCRRYGCALKVAPFGKR